MRIMNFSNFVNESYQNFSSLPKNLQDFFVDATSKNILSKTVGLNDFDIILDGKDIYFSIKGKKVLFPFISYVDGSIVLNDDVVKNLNNAEAFNISIGLNWNFLINSWVESSERLKERDGEPNSVGGNIIYKGITVRVYSSSREITPLLVCRTLYSIFQEIRKMLESDNKVLNPFIDIDLENNPLIKILNKLGAYIDTSESRKKKGIIRFSLRDFNYGLIIQPNGYIRRDLGHKTPILTSKVEISGPMYTEDDLNLKLSYLIGYLMKDLLVYKFNIPVKDANKLCKLYVSGDIDSYSDLLSVLATKDPLISATFPDPNDVLDTEVKKGASMLNRFNLF